MSALHDAIAAYDAVCNREAVAARVKGFRAQGRRIDRIVEELDENGVPRRMELHAQGRLVWAYNRDESGMRAPPKPAAVPPPVSIIPPEWDDDDDGFPLGRGIGGW